MEKNQIHIIGETTNIGAQRLANEGYEIIDTNEYKVFPVFERPPIPIYSSYVHDFELLTGSQPKSNDLKRCKKGVHNYLGNQCIHCKKEIK